MGNNIENATLIKRALLVEDNEINAEIAKLQLEDVGYEVEWVTNGARAVECFGDSMQGYYSLILMDIMMPVMDGLEAIRIIRNLNREDSKTVPIIAITANAFQEDKEQSYSNGASCFISKPYGKKQLQDIVKSFEEKIEAGQSEVSSSLV